MNEWHDWITLAAGLLLTVFGAGILAKAKWDRRRERDPPHIDGEANEEEDGQRYPGLAPTVQPRPRPIPRDPIDEVHNAIAADDDPDDDALERKRILDRERARLDAAPTRREHLDHLRAGRRDREADD